MDTPTFAAVPLLQSKSTKGEQLRKPKSHRGRPTRSLADRMDRLADHMRRQKNPRGASHRLLMETVYGVSFTVIAWVISFVEVAAGAREDEDHEQSASFGFSVDDPKPAISRLDSDSRLSFGDNDAIRERPHLTGRFGGLDRDLSVLIDPGSEATFIHKNAVPADQYLFDVTAFPVAGVGPNTITIDQGLVIDLEVLGCTPAGTFQKGSGNGAELCSRMLQMGVEPGVVSAKRNKDVLTPRMRLQAYVASDDNGGVDVVMGTNVLCRYNAALSMGERGTLTFDLDLGAGVSRMEAPLDWKLAGGPL